MQFLKIATQMFPAERIESINTEAKIGDELGVEIFLHGIPESFQFTGQTAGLAYDILAEGNIAPALNVNIPLPTIVTVNGKPVDVLELTAIDGEPLIISLDGKPVDVSQIEWVDFKAQMRNSESLLVDGIELRVATDPAGCVRQFFGEAAGTAYDVLEALESDLSRTHNQAVGTAAQQ